MVKKNGFLKSASSSYQVSWNSGTELSVHVQFSWMKLLGSFSHRFYQFKFDSELVDSVEIWMGTCLNTMILIWPAWRHG